jgi:arylsulfatase A-like enzyme
MQNRNYVTYHVGKWGISVTTNSTGHILREKETSPNGFGYNNFFGLMAHAANHFTKEVVRKGRVDLHRWEDQNNIYKSYPELNHEPTVHSTDMFGREANNYLINHVKNKKNVPFFMVLAFTAPHDPLQAAESEIGNKECSHLHTWRRRTYCEMVVHLDKYNFIYILL